MDIIDAIHDSNIFRAYVTGEADGDLASWANWLAFLRVLYGLPVPETDRELVKRCTGRDIDKLPCDGFAECLLMCGRRSGKSKTIALVGAYEAILSGREQAMAPGEIPLVVVVSPTKNQSRIIATYMRGVFESTGLLQREVEDERSDGFTLKNGVEVQILSGSPKTVRGFSVISAIVDEVAFFGLTEESAKRSDTELVRSLRPALATTGGRLLCVGTPYGPSGYVYQTYKRCFGNDSADVLVWNAPSTVMNPTLSTSVVARAVAEDPVAANVEFCTLPGLFREDVEQFISRSAIEALVVPNRKELPPREGVAYAGFCDVSGGRHDDAALAIAHKEGTTIVLDLLERWRAPHDPHMVVAAMAAALRRYGLNTAVGDAYAAEWSRTTFASYGIDYRRCTKSEWKMGAAGWSPGVAKPKAQLYLELLPRLTSGEVELLDDETLIVQLSSLQRRVRSGSRDNIDHPPGGKDDVANALAGVCDAVSHKRTVAGAPGYGTLTTNDVGATIPGWSGGSSPSVPIEPAWAREAKLKAEFHYEFDRYLHERHLEEEQLNGPPEWVEMMRICGRQQ